MRNLPNGHLIRFFVMTCFGAGLLFSFQNCSGYRPPAEEDQMVAKLAPSATSGSEYRSFGYYWVDSDPTVHFGRYLEETASYTNILTLQPYEIARAREASDKYGMKIILDVHGCFFVPTTTSRGAAYRVLDTKEIENRWRQPDCGPAIGQFVSSTRMFAFYLLDEAYSHILIYLHSIGVRGDEAFQRARSEISNVVRFLHEKHPYVAVMMTASPARFNEDVGFLRWELPYDPPEGIDIYSLSCYEGDDEIPEAQRERYADWYDYCLKQYQAISGKTKKVLATVHSFQWGRNGAVPIYEKQKQWAETFSKIPNNIGLFWFLYPDTGKKSGVEWGSVHYPDVLQAHREISRTAFCANTSETYPVCGANKRTYQNPDLLKCANTTIAAIGACPNEPLRVPLGFEGLANIKTDTYYFNGKDHYCKYWERKADAPTFDAVSAGQVLDGDCQKPAATYAITGHIDGIYLRESKRYLMGWACMSGSSDSIDVHVYLGGPAGSSKTAFAARANTSSEPAVASACQSQGANHRFQIELTNDLRGLHAGLPIYVHGISTHNTPNLLLYNSGTFYMPEREDVYPEGDFVVSGERYHSNGKAFCKFGFSGDLSGLSVHEILPTGMDNHGECQGTRPVPMYRAFHPISNDHFFTANKGEYDGVPAGGYTHEGVGFHVLLSGIAGSKSIFRFFSTTTGKHYYTMSEEKRDDLVRRGWSYEGVAGFIFDKPVPNTKEVYHLYNNANGDHLYTQSAEERTAVLTRWPDIWIPLESLGFAP